ncbi:MAG: DUF402 domain-containing protein [Vicinamibacterales bacterium]
MSVGSPNRSSRRSASWSPHGTVSGWYGNLKAPLRRTEIGVHTHDHVLDVWLDADGSVTFKDDDHGWPRHDRTSLERRERFSRARRPGARE